MSDLLAVLRQIAAKNCKKDITLDWLAEDSNGAAFFSYSSDFDCLWGIDAEGVGLAGIADELCAKNGQVTVVIVWDKIPSGNTGAVNTGRYLTPIDWAVALSLTIGKRAENLKKNLPDVRVLILDLGSRMVPGSDSMQVISYVQSEMPWIRLFRHNVKGDKWYAAFVNEIIAESSQVPFMKDAKHRLDLIERLWQTALTKTSRPDDHHAIANLLGPILLAGESGIGDEILLEIGALRELTKALGFYPTDEKEKGEDGPDSVNGQEEKSEYLDWKGVGNRLRELKATILLLDDQWQTGWGRTLCNLLGKEYRLPEAVETHCFLKLHSDDDFPVVKASSDPSWLVDRLKAAEKNQRFKLKLDSSVPVGNFTEILFLDLRLFTGKEISKEAKFIQKLVNLALDLMSEENLPWNGLNKTELKRIAEWAESASNTGSEECRKDSRYFEALTLLPRVIAEIDLSYPVIVFSSTGRREIAKRFEPYGNLLADFEKPRFTGMFSTDTVAEARERLFNSLERSLDILAARQLCVALPVSSPRPPAVSTNTGSWKVELYIDETGTEMNKERLVPFRSGTITIGGLLAVYSPSKLPEKFNKELTLKIKDIFVGITDQESQKKALRTEANNLVDWTLQQSTSSAPDYFALVTLKGQVDSNNEELGFLEYSGVGDNLYRETISSLIEIAVYHHARSYIPLDTEVEYKIFMPTRQLPIENEAAERNAHVLASQWGMEIISSNAIDMYKFNNIAKILGIEVKAASPSWKSLILFGSDAARPIIQQVAKQYRFSRFRPRAEHGRAYSNNSFTISNISERPLHYLIDAVLAPIGNRDKINLIQENGFSGLMTDDLKTLLHACRLNDNGFPGDALSIGATLSAKELQSEKRQACHVLSKSLADAANRVTGREYQQFVSQIRQQSKLEKHRSIQEGVIIQMGSQFKVRFNKQGIINELGVDKSSIKSGVTDGDKVKFRLIHGELPGRWYAQLINNPDY